MSIFAIAIAAYAVAVLFVQKLGAPFVADRLATMPFAVWAHFVGAAVALATGTFQHNARLRAKYLSAHRWTGRAYVIGVLVGGIGALMLAPAAEGGAPGKFGFAMLGILWLVSTALAYTHIRNGNQTAHRRWMVRSYALTLAAVTLRIYLPLSLASGVPFTSAYPVIAWMCWVPNLVFAEWVLLTRPETVRA
jgi:uncharacterized membrane protein